VAADCLSRYAPGVITSSSGRGAVVKRALKQAVSGLRAAVGERLVAVVLFGSRARGDAQENSDWDLLVIADGLPDGFFDRRLLLKNALPTECRGEVAILARTPSEFKAHMPSLYLDTALDGHILYDSRGYAAQKLTI